MPFSQDANDKERERLLAIIARDRPERKPGTRTRAWERNREGALERLRRLDAGKDGDIDSSPW